MAKSRIFLLFMLAFVAGVAARSFIDISAPFFFFMAAVASSAFFFGILRASRRDIIFSVFFLSFLFGVFRLERAEMARPDLTSLYGRPRELRGVVWKEPEYTELSQRLKMKVMVIEGSTGFPSFFIQIATRRYPKYQIGDELMVRGTLEEPENFGEFDYAAHLAKENVFSTVSFPSIEKVGEGKGSKLRLILSRIKRSFEEKIEAALPEPHAAFLKGLLLGERRALSKDLVENFARTGTTHIVALSGYNITLVGRFFTAAFIFFLIPRRFSFWIAAFAITLFVVLTGASPSVVRAGIMGALLLIAEREGRLYSMTNALVFAAAMMIFENPMILRFDAAFQLSFLAVLGLVYIAPRLDERFGRFVFWYRKRLRKEEVLDPQFTQGIKGKTGWSILRKIFIETLAAQLAVLPLLIFLFGRVSFISPISNLLVLVAVPYSMFFGFLTGLAGFMWEPLSIFLGWGAWILLEYKLRLIEFFAAFPLAAIEARRWVLLPILALYAWFLFRLAPRKAKSGFP